MGVRGAYGEGRKRQEENALGEAGTTAHFKSKKSGGGIGTDNLPVATFAVVARGVGHAGCGRARARAEGCAGRWGMRCGEVREGGKEGGTGPPADDTPCATRASNLRPHTAGQVRSDLRALALPIRLRGRCSRRRPLPHATYPIAAKLTQCPNFKLSPLAQSSPHAHCPRSTTRLTRAPTQT